MGSSHNGFSVWQSVISSFKEIRFEDGIEAYDAHGHKVDDPSEVAVAPLGDSACALELTRLVHGGVKACKSDKAPVGAEVVDAAHFGKKGCPRSGIDTVYGSKDFEVFDGRGLTELSEGPCYPVEPFHEVKEGGYLLWQDELLGRAYGSNGSFGCLDDLFGRDIWSSSSAVLTEGRRYVPGAGGSNDMCGRELPEEVEHGLCKDIAHGLKLGEGALKEPFDFVLGGCDEAGEGLSLPGDVSEVPEVLGDVNPGDGFIVDEKETGYSKGVLSVGLGLSEGEFGEVGDEEGVEDHCLTPPGGEKGKEIDVVAASGFHGDKSRGELLAIGRDGLEEFRKALFVHIGREGKDDFAFSVKTCGGEGILGDINSDEKTIQSNTSLKSCGGKAGEASRPILHGDEGSWTQSTYHGYGRQGTDSCKDSRIQVKWSSPAFPSLLCEGKTRSSDKRYSINFM